jgi:hypothetical protein
MNFESLTPPDNLLGDASSLGDLISNDAPGGRTRQVVEYFKQAEMKAREMQLHSVDYETRRVAGIVIEALGACHVIVAEVWQKAHGHALIGR